MYDVHPCIICTPMYFGLHFRKKGSAYVKLYPNNDLDILKKDDLIISSEMSIDAYP